MQFNVYCLSFKSVSMRLLLLKVQCSKLIVNVIKLNKRKVTTALSANLNSCLIYYVNIFITDD